VADKLEFRMTEERLNMSLIIESIDGIQQGLNPRVLGSMLSSYLPSKQRASEDEEV
jgi:chemotaxis protein MotA